MFKQQHLIDKFSSEIIFMHRLDLLSVMNITEIPCVVLTDTMEQEEILKILKCKGVKGVSGMLISEPCNLISMHFKNHCISEGIQMTSLEVR